jgi:uncharacterized membrane protein
MSQGDKPRSEPEIMPPDHASRDKRHEQAFAYMHGAEHVYVARVEPFGFILIALTMAILLAVLLALLLATLLIWLPLLILFVGGIIIGRIIMILLFSR